MRALLLLLLVAVAIGSVHAGDETARSVLDDRSALDAGARRWSTRQANVVLVATDRDGIPVTRTLVVYERKTNEGHDTVAFVTAPADLKGTAFLALSRTGRATEHWSRAPGEPPARADGDARVLDADLTLRDLDVLDRVLTWTDADVRATLRGVENVDGEAAWAIELVPLRDDVGYQRVMLWLGRDDLVVREVQLFSGAGAVPAKRVLVTRVRNEGAIPWIETIEVTSPKAGSRTKVDLTGVMFNPKLDADLFTPQALERGAP